MDLFDYLLLQSRDHWSAQPEQPPDFLWARGDVVPVGMFGWHDSLWTCLRRDGRVVTCDPGAEDAPFPDRAHNSVIGRLMQQVPAASAYLRPPARAHLCAACEGSGKRKGSPCECGALGWIDGSE